MDLYVEREFLDYFDIDFTDRPIQRVVKEIITEYGRKKVFINYDINDFKVLDDENRIFALINNVARPNDIDSIEEHLFFNSDFKQTLVFTSQSYDWFKAAEDKGALCFSFENYEKKIEEIINQLHFRIDLSEKFNGWNFLQAYKLLSFNNITITDRYILKDNKTINNNLIPILKHLLLKKNDEIKIGIFAEKFNSLSDNKEHVKETAKKIYTLLNREFAKTKAQFSVINSNHIFDVDVHDRIILTNFSFLGCGKGFDFAPNKRSNSEILSETIFNKYTYKRLNNLNQVQADYFAMLKRTDAIKFKMYPEK
tara:strand:- start:66 stop:995 length:930 start_codon:yes stop_codon:yes gene_type:complete